MFPVIWIREFVTRMYCTELYNLDSGYQTANFFAGAIGRTFRLWQWNLNTSKCPCTAGTAPIRHRHHSCSLDGRNVWEVRGALPKLISLLFVQVHVHLALPSKLCWMLSSLVRPGSVRRRTKNLHPPGSHKPVLDGFRQHFVEHHRVTERSGAPAEDIGSYWPLSHNVVFNSYERS